MHAAKGSGINKLDGVCCFGATLVHGLLHHGLGEAYRAQIKRQRRPLEKIRHACTRGKDNHVYAYTEM